MRTRTAPTAAILRAIALAAPELVRLEAERIGPPAPLSDEEREFGADLARQIGAKKPWTGQDFLDHAKANAQLFDGVDFDAWVREMKEARGEG